MLNERFKMDFINQYTSSVNTYNNCVDIFKAIGNYELRYGKDVREFDMEQMQKVVDELVGIRSAGKYQKISLLRKYIEYCISKGIQTSDCIFEIKSAGIAKISKQMVSSPLHMQKYLNAICDLEDKKTVDNVYRVYYWLAYAGVKEDDIFKIEAKHVDLLNGVVFFEGKEYVLYQQSYKAFENCMHCKEFNFEHPNYSTVRARVGGNQLIRGVREEQSVKGLRVELSRRSRKSIEQGRTNIKMSYYRARLSGLFYRMYELESNGLPVNFTYIAKEEQMANKKASENKSISEEQYLYRLERTYKEDYERWKLAFSL